MNLFSCAMCRCITLSNFSNSKRLSAISELLFPFSGRPEEGRYKLVRLLFLWDGVGRLHIIVVLLVLLSSRLDGADMVEKESNLLVE